MWQFCKNPTQMIGAKTVFIVGWFAGQYFFQSYRSFFFWPKFFYRTVFCGWVSFTALLPTGKSRKRGDRYLAKNKTFDFLPTMNWEHDRNLIKEARNKSGFFLLTRKLIKKAFSMGKSSLHSHFLFIPFLFSLISMQKCIYISFLSFFLRATLAIA